MDAGKRRSHAAIFYANVFLGLNLPFTKDLLTTYVTPTGYMVLRASAAALLFWGIGCFTRREHVRRKDLGLIATGSLLGFVLSQYLTAVSLEYTTPVYFSLISAMSPVVVMLLAAVFLREPVSLQKVSGVVLSVAGTLLLILHADDNPAAGSHNLFGILLACVSIVAFSAYLIIMRTVSPRYTPVTQMKWTFLFAGIVLLPVAFVSLPSQPLFNGAGTGAGYGELAFVILCATTVSIYMNLQPVVASGVAIVLGQDAFTWEKPVAALLVITGAYIVTNSPARKAE